MVYMTRCCCYDNTKDGSFACAIYTGTTSAIVALGSTIILCHEETFNAIVEERKVAPSVLHQFYLSALIDAVAMLLASILLGYGVRIEKRQYFLPWMCLMFMECVLFFLACVGIFYIFVAGVTGYIMTFAFIMLVFVGNLTLNVYLTLCVVSQYQILAMRPPAGIYFYTMPPQPI